MRIKQKIYSVKKFLQEDIDKVEQSRQELFNETESSALLLSQETDDTLVRINNIADRIRDDFQNLVIIGAGASINVPKMLWSFASSTMLNVHFVERVDAIKVNDIFTNHSPKDTCVLVISKSGSTIEVNLLLSKFIQWFKKSLSDAELKSRLYFITEANSKLDKFALSLNASVLEHPVNIGGRFSFFNTTGLLPAKIFGFSVADIILSVKESFAKLISSDSWVTEGVLYNYSMSKMFNQSVLVKYNTVFDGALSWLKQLIAESLGKEGQGITPIISDGIVDRHSQLQLYLDGPNDKFFTLFLSAAQSTMFDWDKQLDNIPESLISESVAGMSFKDFNGQQEKALLSTLSKSGKNIRNLTMKSVDSSSVSEFIMGHMLEVILYAYLNGINPFGQPAIERFKYELSIIGAKNE